MSLLSRKELLLVGAPVLAVLAVFVLLVGYFVGRLADHDRQIEEDCTRRAERSCASGTGIILAGGRCVCVQEPKPDPKP
jgi:hypothetical protein